MKLMPTNKFCIVTWKSEKPFCTNKSLQLIKGQKPKNMFPAVKNGSWPRELKQIQRASGIRGEQSSGLLMIPQSISTQFPGLHLESGGYGIGWLGIWWYDCTLPQIRSNSSVFFGRKVTRIHFESLECVLYHLMIREFLTIFVECAEIASQPSNSHCPVLFHLADVSASATAHLLCLTRNGRWETIQSASAVANI